MLQKIPTGCISFDKILEGGFHSEGISLVYGEPETGKTALAIQCAVNCARKDCKILFVDCDNTFHPRRLSQIAGHDYDKVAELIMLMRPNSFREQTIIVDQLPDYVTTSLGLIVFDTVTSLYRLRVAELPTRTFELNRELNRQLASLAQLARTQKVPILLTSQVRNVLKESSGDTVPVATRVVRFWAETIIEMKPTENLRIVKATLEKNPEKTTPVTCSLIIEETGIHEYPAH